MLLKQSLLAAAISVASINFANAALSVDLNDSPSTLNSEYTDSLTLTGTQSQSPVIFRSVKVDGDLTFNASISATGEGSTGLRLTDVTTRHGTVDTNPDTYAGDIVNTGTITATGANSTGMLVEGTGQDDNSVTGTSFINDGQIVATGGGSTGLHLSGAEFHGVLSNNGTISGGARGIDLDSSGDSSGSMNTYLNNIDNAGSILATDANGRAITIDGATFYKYNKGLINTGTIRGGAVGVDFDKFTMEDDQIQHQNSNVDFDKVHFQILAEKGEISGGQYAIKGGSQRVDLVLGNTESRGTATIRGNLDGIALTSVVGPAQFFGTNIQSEQVRIRPGASLSLNDPHTTIDGDLYIEGGALGLPLSAETRENTPVLTVTGAANLGSGSSIVINAKGSDFATGGVTYDLISAKSLNVESDVQIKSSSALLTVNDAVSANGKLKVKVTAVSKEEVGEVVGGGGGNANDQQATESFLSVAALLGASNPDNPVLKAVLAAGNDKEAITAIVKELSPDVNGGAASAAFSSQTMVTSVINTRNAELRKGESSGDELKGAGAWFQILNNNANQDVRSGIEGYNADSNGFALGADRKLNENTTLGVAYSYVKTDVKSDGGNKTDVENHNLTAYGSWTEGHYFVDGDLSYGMGKNESKRYVAGTTAKGDYDSDMIGLGLIAGYGFQFDSGILVEPRVTARYSNLSIDGFTEKGSAAALTTGDQRLEVGDIGAGVRVAGAFDVARGTLEPELKLMAYHDVIGDKTNTTSAFVLGGNTFVSNGASPARDSYQIGVGANYILGAVTVGAGYDRLMKTGFDADTFTANVRYDF